jgi:hypothetical protein
MNSEAMKTATGTQAAGRPVAAAAPNRSFGPARLLVAMTCRVGPTAHLQEGQVSTLTDSLCPSAQGSTVRANS